MRPVTLAHHVGQSLLGAQEGPTQVDAQDVIPRLGTHPQHQRIAGDARVVYQNIDPAPVLRHIPHEGSSLLRIGDISREEGAFTTGSSDAGLKLGRSFTIGQVVQADFGTGTRQY